MQIYLAIAEIPVNVFMLLALGGVGGILAGMFGIGGGFLITPLLIFIGVPPPVAVATSTNQIIASSVSGFLAHWYRKNVDIKMGVYLLGGGLIGAFVGVQLFAILERIGQIDLAISLSYVVFLGSIGTLMAIESSRTILDKRKGKEVRQAGSRFAKLREKQLPLMVYFPRSDITISALLPIGIGVLAGMMVSLMGIGGGFLMIPAMIYVLGMPTSVVVGTSLFQIIFTTSAVTIMHAVTTHSVDIMLAMFLILGGVIGAQFGTLLGLKVPAEKLRILLAVMVLLVCLRLAFGLFLEPDHLFNIEVMK